MTQPNFTPALGRLGAGQLYDSIVALTGERHWRGLATKHLELSPEDLVVDVGCGSGSHALMMHAAQPRARIVGVDPDERMLALARQKAHKAGATLEFRRGMGDALSDVLSDLRPNKLVSSLVLHQCPLPMKRAVLASMYGILAPGGRLVIADFGLQRSFLMRSAFRIVQFVDGVEDTQPNADGILAALIEAAGFLDVREAEVVPTITGSLSIYVANKS
jgi:ubiquinone/menaquinone biosynthesis C-methylase UbiE